MLSRSLSRAFVPRQLCQAAKRQSNSKLGPRVMSHHHPSSHHPTATRWMSASSGRSAPETYRRRGNVLIGLGWTLLGLLALDQLLQYRQEQETQERRLILQKMQEEADQENSPQWDTTGPTLFQCKIMHTEPSLDGTKMLRFINVGDVVEVLEADVGPNKAYHVCRNPDSDRPGSTGWYPKQYLERMEG